ncbi:MAG TPA: rhodanese-like domain-containing protein [Chthoniobacterales bacterium]
MPDLPFELSVEEVHGLREQHDDVLLLDVREADEVATAKIEGSVHIPLNTLPAAVQMGQFAPDKNKRIIVHCHHGMRSARATSFLRAAGYGNAQNMAGGIEEWSVRVDPEVPRY